MTDPVELEMEDDSELKDQPVKDLKHPDPLKELDLDETKPEKDPAAESETGSVKPETGSKERVPTAMSPSEEERSATRTLIRQPEPVLETSDGEDEPEQV